MLVLSRKVGERVQIGDDVTIEIRRIAGNRVALAFSAPDEVRILRAELDPFSEHGNSPKNDFQQERRGVWANRDLAVH